MRPMTISRARPVVFLRRRMSSKARRRVQNLLLLTRQQRQRPSSSTPKDLTFCVNSDLWRERTFSVKNFPVFQDNVCLLFVGVFAITPNCRHARSTPERPRVDRKPDPSLCHEDGRDRSTQGRETRWPLSRSDQNTTTTNIPWAAPTTQETPTFHFQAQL